MGEHVDNTAKIDDEDCFSSDVDEVRRGSWRSTRYVISWLPFDSPKKEPTQYLGKAFNTIAKRYEVRQIKNKNN